MKKTKLFIGIFTCAAIAVASFAGLSSFNNKSNSPNIVGVSVQSADGSTNVDMDMISYDTVKSLTSNSKIVVRGTVVKKSDKTRNLSLNPLNPKEEDKNRKTISQEYNFNVTNWLKGNGDSTINIVYPDYTEIKNGEKISDGNEPLIEGKEYILFLSSGIDGTYFGTAEPWQFKINSNNIKNTLSEVESKEDKKAKKVEFVTKSKDVKFSDMKDNTLYELESLIKK